MVLVGGSMFVLITDKGRGIMGTCQQASSWSEGVDGPPYYLINKTIILLYNTYDAYIILLIIIFLVNKLADDQRGLMEHLITHFTQYMYCEQPKYADFCIKVKWMML